MLKCTFTDHGKVIIIVGLTIQECKICFNALCKERSLNAKAFNVSTEKILSSQVIWVTF